jgi:hypothetical protein
MLCPVGKKEFQFEEQFLPSKAQQSADARILQGSYGQTTPQQYRFKPSGDPRTKAALRIKEEPTARVPSFSVCILVRERNHDLPRFHVTARQFAFKLPSSFRFQAG